MKVPHESGPNESIPKFDYESGRNESNQKFDYVSGVNESSPKFGHESGTNESIQKFDYECVTSREPGVQNKCQYNPPFDWESANSENEVCSNVSKYVYANSFFHQYIKFKENSSEQFSYVGKLIISSRKKVVDALKYSKHFLNLVVLGLTRLGSWLSFSV